MLPVIEIMIFVLDEADTVVEVSVYESLEQLANMVEWQDFFEGKSIILDEEGKTYSWDTSKTEEYGFTYGYTLTAVGTNHKLLDKCMKQYEESGRPDEFEMDKKEMNKYR
jgi:hypothetical protein